MLCTYCLFALEISVGHPWRSGLPRRMAPAPSFRLHSFQRRHPRSDRASDYHDAALVLEKLGGDASDFAARQLTSRIASDADLILTMTRAHRDTVLELAPRQLHRTFTLSEAALLASECDAQSVADLAAFRPQSPRTNCRIFLTRSLKAGILCDGWFTDCRPPAADTRALPAHLRSRSRLALAYPPRIDGCSPTD